MTLTKPASASFFMPSRFFYALPCTVKAHPLPTLARIAVRAFLCLRSDRLKHQNLTLYTERSLVHFWANEL